MYWLLLTKVCVSYSKTTPTTHFVPQAIALSLCTDHIDHKSTQLKASCDNTVMTVHKLLQGFTLLYSVPDQYFMPTVVIQHAQPQQGILTLLFKNTVFTFHSIHFKTKYYPSFKKIMVA